MIQALSISRWSLWNARRAEASPVSQGSGIQVAPTKIIEANRADQGEGQCATVLQIIERVCASHQEQLGFYTFLAWGDFQKHF
ncbi:MAG: hypothetical protein HYW07_13820 [Candidatus Latescibacteria bacterium]|nr:hypothetical protein [Candidatus Latescibacterota bacterium]